MNTSTLTKGGIAIVVAVILVVAGFFYWKNYYKPSPEDTGRAEETSLGGEIFTKVTNPVSGQLPETTAPAPNPLKGIYKNPFE